MSTAAWIILIAAASKKTCPYCKTRNERKAERCIECGRKLPPERELSKNEKIAIVAFVSILAIIIGLVLFSTTLV